MNGLRATVGFSLLCVLAFCAIAASSASAADGKGTTQFTCVKVDTPKTGEFDNEDCSVGHPKKEGEYRHVAIALGTKTTNVGVDPKKQTLSRLTIDGLLSWLQCGEGTTSGTATNEEPAAGMHKLTGTDISFVFTKCDVEIGTEKPCPVTKFELTVLKSVDVEKQTLTWSTGGKKFMTNVSMGIKFEPTVGTKLGSLTIDKTCKGGGKTLNFEGTFLAVPIGARLTYLEGETESTMTAGGVQASLGGEMTVRMSGAGGEPIAPATTDKLPF